MTTTVSAVNLPFEQAIDFFGQKTNATSEHWTDVWQRANARAFTVAGAATDALVGDFRAEITKALEQGTTLAEFRKGFDQIVAKHGWEHTGTPGWRSRIIYETNLSMAYAAGRWAQQTAPETLAAFPYWQYVHSGSLHPRLNHLAWDGLTLRADDDRWSTHYPPNGWRCGCRVRPLSARGLARQGKSAPDQAPPIAYRDWTNPKTGEVHQVPKGIDPSFDYNPGQAWLGTKPEIPANATFNVPPIRPAPAAPEPGPTDAPLRPTAPFRPAAPSADAPVRVAPAERVQGVPLPANREYPWPAPPERALPDLVLRDQVVEQGQSLGLWDDADTARRFVGRLVGGLPDDLTVKVHASFDGRLTIRADGPGVTFVRGFEHVDGETVVENALFSLSEDHQKGGYGRAMLRAAVEEYRRAGVARIEVHANIDVGGYAWAKFGFAPVGDAGDIAELRAELMAKIRARSGMTSVDRDALVALVRDTPTADLMYELAHATNAAGRRIGKSILLNSNWFGALDLGDPVQYNRLIKELSGP